jgi:MFS family permease
MLNASLGVNAPARHRASGFAIVEMAGGLASSMGPIVGGFLYARRDTLTFETAIVLGLLLMPVILMENRRARAWPHEVDPVLTEDEPVIDKIPELAPEVVPALDFQPVIVADPAPAGGNASPKQP